MPAAAGMRIARKAGERLPRSALRRRDRSIDRSRHLCCITIALTEEDRMARVPTVQSIWARALWGAVVVVGLGADARAIQAPVPLPATHERQCVATGDVLPGGTRRVTVAWKRPFATEKYDVIGSVGDAVDGDRSLELSHLIVPYTPEATSAVVLNRDAGAAHSGILCLDASVDITVAADAPH